MSEERTVTRFISIHHDFQTIQDELSVLPTQSQEINTLLQTLESFKSIIDSGIQPYVSDAEGDISEKYKNAIIEENLAQQYKNTSNSLRTKLSLAPFSDDSDLDEVPIPPPPSPVTPGADFPFLEITPSSLGDMSSPQKPPSSVSFFKEYPKEESKTITSKTTTTIPPSRCDLVLRFSSSLWMVGSFMTLAVISIVAVYASQKEAATSFIKETPSTESAKDFFKTFDTALTVYLSAFAAVIIMAVAASCLKSKQKEPNAPADLEKASSNLTID